jgi:RNA polymerase sigma factor (sigma-70 family)
MAQATLSAKHETPARQYLSAEQELSLVAQVKERTELLKRKQDNFTLEEHRIRIRGERAFNTLLDDYQGVMWRLVIRYSFLNRLTLDEMYQIAMVAVERAVSTHDPKRAGKQRKFSSWVFLKISSRFISLYRTELVHSRKLRAAYEGARNSVKPKEYRMPDPLPKVNLKEVMLKEIESTLTPGDAQILKDYYIHRTPRRTVAQRLGYSLSFLDIRKREGLRQLRSNPRIQELAETYLA